MAQVFADNFTSNSLTGTLNLSDGYANLSLPTNPFALEGDKSFRIKFRRLTPDGILVATSPTMTLKDYSSVTSLTANVVSINEGNTVLLTLITANASDNANLYYSVLPMTPNLYANDFFLSANTGMITLNGNQATFTFRANADESLYDETGEKFQVQLRTRSITGNVVYTSSNITINDTSRNYNVQSFVEDPDANTLDLSNVSFNLTAYNIPANSTVYYRTAGNATVSDFVGGNTGSFTFTGTNTSFTYNIGDLATDEMREFRVEVSDTASGNAFANSNVIYAYDPGAFPWDVHYANVAFILTGEGQHNANGNIFVESAFNEPLTKNGNVFYSAFSPLNDKNGWCWYFDKNDSYVKVVDNPGRRLLTGPFTVEYWTKHIANTTSTLVVSKYKTTTTGIDFREEAGTGTAGAHVGPALYTGITRNISGNSVTPSANSDNFSSNGYARVGEWHHVAFVRSNTGAGGTKVFINGKSYYTGTFAANDNTGQHWIIGERADLPGGSNGGFFIRSLRIANAAIYSANFTPCTKVFTTTTAGANPANVILLTAQSNRFIDESIYGANLELFQSSTGNYGAGQPKIVSLSPHRTNDDGWDPNINGGSVTFAGSASYLQTRQITGRYNLKGDYTIDVWCYANTNASTGDALFQIYDSVPGVQQLLRMNGDNWEWYYATTGNVTLVPITANYNVNTRNQISNSNIGYKGWVHHVLTKKSGNVYWFINGMKVKGPISNNANLAQGNSYIRFGNYSGYPWNGFLGQFRLVNGTAVYANVDTSNTITVPTSTLANVTNTVCLLNHYATAPYEHKGYVANIVGANIKLSNTAGVGGSGNTAIFFPGLALPYPTGENITLTPSGTQEEQTIWQRPYTFETWMNPYRIKAAGILRQALEFNTSAGGVYFYVRLSAAGTLESSELNSSAGAITANTWTHVALVRDEPRWIDNIGMRCNVRIYLNGILNTENTNIPPKSYGNQVDLYAAYAPWYLGWNQPDFTVGNGQGFHGYLEDTRLTIGTARYTSDFTPPSRLKLK